MIQIAWVGKDQVPALKINEQSVNWGDLRDRLLNIFNECSNRVVFVKGDDEVDFQYIAEAISIARGSGVEKVGLLTRTGPESP